MASNKLSKYIRITWLLVWLPFLILFFVISFISLELFIDLPSVAELQNPKSNWELILVEPNSPMSDPLKFHRKKYRSQLWRKSHQAV